MEFSVSEFQTSQMPTVPIGVVSSQFQPRKRGRPTLEMVAARKAQAEAQAVARANVPKKTDAEIIADIAEGFNELALMTEDLAAGRVRAMIVTSLPGMGKTYTINQKLEQMGRRYISTTGGVSAAELYKLSYKYKHRGENLVFDDCDNIFRDEDSLNLLKAMCDTTRKRVVSWRKDNRSMSDDNIEKSHTFEGGVIFSTNLDFQSFVDEGKNKYATHMQGLISRAYYLDLHLHDTHSLSLWINHVAVEGKMFDKEDISPALGQEILGFLHQNKDTLREYSLRTVKKVCDLTKSKHGNWERRAKKYLCRTPLTYAPLPTTLHP